MNQEMENIKNTTTGALSNAAMQSKDMLEKVSGVTENIGEKAQGMIESAADSTKEVADKVVDMASDTISKAINKIGNWKNS